MNRLAFALAQRQRVGSVSIQLNCVCFGHTVQAQYYAVDCGWIPVLFMHRRLEQTSPHPQLRFEIRSSTKTLRGFSCIAPKKLRAMPAESVATFLLFYCVCE